mmetsp:Transcript_41237/g.56194  ORF Transcript_41237/g.56194 Transcript_41237/m.56194 type:complete len:118 (+) Transcript_41237:171-524(+)
MCVSRDSCCGRCCCCCCCLKTALLLCCRVRNLLLLALLVLLPDIGFSSAGDDDAAGDADACVSGGEMDTRFTSRLAGGPGGAADRGRTAGDREEAGGRSLSSSSEGCWLWWCWWCLM